MFCGATSSDSTSQSKKEKQKAILFRRMLPFQPKNNSTYKFIVCVSFLNKISTLLIYIVRYLRYGRFLEHWNTEGSSGGDLDCAHSRT